MKTIIILIAMLFNFQSATLYETYDDVAVFETTDGNLWEVFVDSEPEPGEYELLFIGDSIVQFAQK